MKYVNAFFRLDIRENGVYAYFYPARDGGKKIDLKEFAEYLEACQITDFDLPQIQREVARNRCNGEVFVSSAKLNEIDERMHITVTEDKLLAIVRFYPPSMHGALMTENDIMAEFRKNKITYGIETKYIKAYLSGRQFCRDIPIAKGVPIVYGKDAEIIYHFNTNPTSKPKLLEDGSVDFHELNIFTSVSRNELLAEVIPEVPGKNGMDIFGNVLKAPAVKKGFIKHGKSVVKSEDGLKAFSEVNGDVRLEGDTIFVSDTYHVAADVDSSTGDIKYDGNVTVTGNVRAGFRIEASGEIEINGAVEGATIISGGNIILKRGVQGMHKAFLQAEGDIVSKFFENCTVKAGNNINTGFALHSNLTAKENVIVSGKKGFLIGGNVSAGSIIQASVFGNKMNTATTLKVGVEPDVLEHFKELSVMIKENQDKMVEYRQTLDALLKKLKEGKKLMPNQLQLLKTANDSITELETALENESEEYMLLKEEIENHKGGKVIVDNKAYPGVAIHMSNRFYLVKEVQNYCQFVLDGVDIVSKPI